MKTDTWSIEISDAGAKATVVVLFTAVAIALGFVTTRANQTESIGGSESAAHRTASPAGIAGSAEPVVESPRNAAGSKPADNAGPAGMTTARVQAQVQAQDPEPMESGLPRVSLTDLSHEVDGGLNDLVGTFQSRKGFDNARAASRTFRDARPAP
jgi:hypothetical protein